MNEVGEIRLLQLCVLSENAVQQLIELSLFLLLAPDIFQKPLRLVLKIGIEGWVKRRHTLLNKLSLGGRL